MTSKRARSLFHTSPFEKLAARAIAAMLAIWLAIASEIAFYHIAWGTGAWLGEFSLRWAMLFALFTAGMAGLLVVGGMALWAPERLSPARNALSHARRRLGHARWLLAIPIMVGPLWFLQYTSWGVVFHQAPLRLLLWCVQLLLLAYLLSSGERLIRWGTLLAVILLTGSLFALAANLRQVTDYPFSLGWSEGNRLWDYSMLFGRSRYLIAPGQEEKVHLSLGRQLVGGLPFLYSGLTIVQERAWLGLVYVVPYAILGWAVFRSARQRPARHWLLAGLWGMLFLLQGPIHPPLIFAAFLTALAWGAPLWLGSPLLVVASYFAVVSRYTWVFAPAMWIGMLEWVSDAWPHGRLSPRGWKRVLSLALAGVFGGAILPNILALFVKAKKGVGFSVRFTSQPLLWYRLLPNATYPPGILLGLLIATAPLIGMLFYLARSGRWELRFWQKMAIGVPLFAFLVVGLIASTKIGGGGDLHNLDMFLIGLLFTAALAWRAGGARWIEEVGRSSWATRILVVTLLALPAYHPLMSLRPIAFAEDLARVATLTDVEDPRLARSPKAMGSLPGEDEVEEALNRIRDEIAAAKEHGDVLFMDQRQLLTFGYVRDVPLVIEYEKKYMMDQAMADNAAYFSRFYQDLAAHRFSLIVSDPLRAPIKDHAYQFGEENNAWVRWVALPTLCYYEPLETFTEMRVQLLVPRGDVSEDCTLPLPQEP